MSIARAFTTRRLKSSVDLRGDESRPQRSNTTTRGSYSIRNKISAPVELVHTTNMLSYNAPDLFPRPGAAPIDTTTSPSSAKSDDDSDSARSATASTPPTSPDTPFPSEKRTTSPEPNHLSCYFTAPKSAMPPVPTEVPAIPQRAPSHTKKPYEGLTRHRSASRLSEQSSRSLSSKSSFTFSRSSSSSTSTSVTSVGHTSVHSLKHSFSATPLSPPPVAMIPTVPPLSHKKEYSDTHPFGHELAQVSELAEEYASSAKDEDVLPAPAAPAAPQETAMDREIRELRVQGLFAFCAEEYLADIRALERTIFGVEAAMPRPQAMAWI
jgi:hypothetical protein